MRAIPLTTVRGGINRLRTKGGARPDVLYDLVNGYRTDSGTVKSRPGTTREHTLNALTRGLVGFDGGLHTFCHEPVEVPDGVTLHVLQYPRGLPGTDPVPPTQDVTYTLVVGNSTALRIVGGYDFDYTNPAALSLNTDVGTLDTSAELGTNSISGIEISNAGDVMIVSRGGSNTLDLLESYSLSTPFDLSTATPSLTLGNQVNRYAIAFTVGNAGFAFYVATSNTASPDGSQNTIAQYNGAFAWQPPASSATAFATINVGSVGQVIKDIEFSTDGTRMFVIISTGLSTAKIIRYTLATAWNLGTASLDADEFALPIGGTSIVNQLLFNDDGTEFLLYTSGLNTLRKYLCASPWTVAGATLDSTTSMDISGSIARRIGLAYKTVIESGGTPGDPQVQPDDRTLEKIHFAQPFMGALYVVAEFDDGAIYHYWLQPATTWEADTVYTRGSFVEPTVPDGLVFEATRLGSPYPSWAPNVPRTADPYDPSIVEPTEYNDFYYTCVDTSGTNPISGTVEPDWPTEDGARVIEDVDGAEVTIATPTEPSTVDAPQQSIIDAYANWYAAGRAGVTP